MIARPQISKEELLQRWEGLKICRNKARRSLLYLCIRVLDYKDVSEEVHWDIIDHLQRFKGGKDEIDEKGQFRYTPEVDLWHLEGPRNTLILYPRGHLKTSIITIAHAIQWIINYPNIRILISTATGNQVNWMLKEIKGHFQYNPKFRYHFPEFCPSLKKAADFGSQEEFTVPNRTKHRKEPTVSTCSVGKVIAGAHYEVIKNSDLVDKENVKTPGQIADVIGHFGYLNPLLERSEVAPHNGWIDVEGTRYDFGDLYGRLLDSGTYRTVVRPKPGEETVWPARFPKSELDRIEKEVGPYIFSCFTEDAPVLMADFTERPIQLLKIGDEIIGYECKGYARLKRAVVEATNSRLADVMEVTTESGRVFQCTPDHKFFIRTHRKRDGLYAKLHVGATLVSTYTPSNPVSVDEQRDLDWLGGIIDGEGTAAGSLSISQSQQVNPEVWMGIKTCLERLNIPFEFRTDSQQFICRGGRSLKIRLLNHARMAKKNRWPEYLWERCNKVAETHGRGIDRVTHIEYIGQRRVFNIQSSTGNYIAHGYATKNCQYRNRPIPPEGGLCDPKDIVFMSRPILNQLFPTLRLHCTIDLHGLEPTRNDNDATALNVHGFDRDGRMYVIDIRHGRFTPSQVIWHIFDIHGRYPQLIDFKIEKDAHARVLLPFLQREASKRQRFPIMVPIKRDTHISKQQRIRGLQPWFKAGIVRFADDLPCKTDLILEIMQFPSQSSGVHDDILDTLADAMQNREGGVTDDVVSDPYLDPREMFGLDKPKDRFLGFGPGGDEEWLYGALQKTVDSPTGVL